MSEVFFTSDSHFGHGNIIKYCHRPFLSVLDKQELSRIGAWHDGVWKSVNSSQWRMSQESIEMMDEAILKEINSMVSENDTLWHLGDFAMGQKHNNYARCRYYRDRIKCQKINIIWGNHDDRSIRDLFNEAYDLKMISLPGLSHRIVLCHYAMAVWEGSHKGNWQLYGHSHTSAEPWMDRYMSDRRSVDVGVDNAYKLFGSFRPFSLSDLQNIFNNRHGCSIDHHVSRNERISKK
jgi:calcineurin-like phosphoesterase family protein